MVFLFLFVTCQITLMRWKTILIQQKTTISVGLHLIFTTSNNLDGMENINSSIENNNTVNLDLHKSPFFGSLYFYPPPPRCDDPTLCLPVVVFLAHLVFIAGMDHFLSGTGDQLSILHELSGFGHCSVLTLTLLQILKQ